MRDVFWMMVALPVGMFVVLSAAAYGVYRLVLMFL